MLVAEILKVKGDAVFTLRGGESLGSAASVLHSRRVGALVVLDEDGRVAGMLSERDVVAEIAAVGPAALQRQVSQCMTADVIVARPTETVDDLLARMTDRRVRHLPVVKDGQLCGIVSIGDLVKSKIAETEAEARGLKAYIAAG